MNYYHLTADIDDDDDVGVQPAVAAAAAAVSSLRTDEDVDEVNDPNWLIIPPPVSVVGEQHPRPQQLTPVLHPSGKVRLRPKQRNLSHRISARLSQLLWNHAEAASSSSSLDANAEEYHQHLPSGSKVNNDDHVAQKITEIFGSFHDDSSSGGANEETSVQTMQPPPVQPQQRPQRRNRRSGNPLRQQRNRHLNTVSTYFNDWTQWLTSNEKKTING